MFILASKSPRRKELLKQIIPDFKIIPSNVDEFKYSLDELSLVKALEIAKDYKEDIIISADTIVILNDQVFGKPQNKEEAYKMLSLLSDNVHEVKTIYTIFCEKLHLSHTRVVTSKVYFNNLTDQNINDYIASGSPLDKAGAYGVQDNDTFHIIDHIEGSYTNIVGLPIDELKEDLLKLGLIA
jgi:septum formation protein